MGGPASSAGKCFWLAVGGRVPVLRIRLAHRHFRQATGAIRDGARGAGCLGALRVPLRDTRRGDSRLRFTACQGNNSAIEAPDLQSSSSSGQWPERTRRAAGITQERSTCEVCGSCPGQGERPFHSGIFALAQKAKGLLGSKSLRPEPATSNNASEAKRKLVPGVTKGQELTGKASLATSIWIQQETARKRGAQSCRGPLASSRRSSFRGENPQRPSLLFLPSCACLQGSHSGGALRLRPSSYNPCGAFSMEGSSAQRGWARSPETPPWTWSPLPRPEPHRVLGAQERLCPSLLPSSPSGREGASRRGNLRGLPGRRRSPCLGDRGSGRLILGGRPRGSSSAGL